MVMITLHKKILEGILTFWFLQAASICNFVFCVLMLPKTKIKYSYGCPVRFHQQHYHKICFQKCTGNFSSSWNFFIFVVMFILWNNLAILWKVLSWTLCFVDGKFDLFRGKFIIKWKQTNANRLFNHYILL